MSLSARFIVVAAVFACSAALANGTGDDRVTLPDGAGSVGGNGGNVALNAAQGSLSLRYPVVVPDGFDGLTPDLAFAYDSNAGGGVLGIGWSIGVSSIERMTHRGLPAYDGTDRIAVDGEEQVQTSPGHYRARFEGGFSRTTWHDRGAGDDGWWTVESSDGRVAYYGADRDGVAVETARERGPDGVLRWLLVDVVDVFGQRLHHRYTVHGSKPLLSRIDYVFADDSTDDSADDGDDVGFYAVALDYETRPDPIGTARGGYNDVLAHRLLRVRVLSSGTEIRRYDLGYEDDDSAWGRSRLARIEQRGRDGGLLEVTPRFVYARSLDGTGGCDGEACGTARLLDLGDVDVDLQARQATLLDLNGDALPDLVEGRDGEAHRIRLAFRRADGTQGFGAATTSALGVLSSGFDLSSPYVQPLDVDGDGDVDLVSASDGSALENTGSGDWARVMPLSSAVTDLPDFGEDFDLGDSDELAHTRFIDIDLDRRIDVLRSDNTSTTIFRNDGDNGFVALDDVEAIGAGFLDNALELADLNGDGLLDPYVLTAGQLRYRLNLGNGRWSAFVTIDDVPVGVDELDVAALEDIDNDGCDDLVIVRAGRVAIARNRAGVRFDDVEVYDDVGGVALPVRDDSVSVLFADMNGNGSTDVVWFSATGQVTALDVTPVPVHLLARIETDNGAVTALSWGTAVAHRTDDAGIGWNDPLPQAVLVVDRTETWTSAATDHEVAERHYTGGFFDGDEASFRGFRTTTTRDVPASGEAGAVLVERFDVGDGGRPWFAGTLLQETRTTDDGAPLAIVDHSYDDCHINAFDAGSVDGVHFVCRTATTRTIQEQRPASEWAVLFEDADHDGYGRVVRATDHGVIAIGDAGCAPCDDSIDDHGGHGGACGDDCGGDEAVTETTWVDPADNVEGRWILDLPVVVAEHDDRGGRVRRKRSFYDGPAFVGLTSGAVGAGLLTREQLEVGDGTTIDNTRRRYDDDGSLVEELSPSADASDVDGGDRHRLVWDALGLHIIEEIDVISRGAGTDQGVRGLRRRYTWEPHFGRMASATTWTNVDATGAGDDEAIVRYGYDEHGRDAFIAEPGDDIATPSMSFSYDNGAPFSRVVTRVRTVQNGAADIERVGCVDGRGRLVQTRERRGDGDWVVDGFTRFNARGQPLAVIDAYSATTDACGDDAPADASIERYGYDAFDRQVTKTSSSGRQTKTVHLPLSIEVWAEDDLTPGAVGEGTPAVLHLDGLERVVRAERRASVADAVEAWRFFYDDTGELAVTVDPEGHQRVQTRDLLDRITGIDDATFGRVTFGYDVDGNVVREASADGAVIVRSYDDLGRVIAEHVDGERDTTLVESFYDVHPACPAIGCASTAARLAGTRTVTKHLGVVEDALSWDARGRLERTSRTVGGVAYVQHNTWDNAGRLTSTTLPDGRVIDHRINVRGELEGVDGYVDDVRHDARARLLGYTLDNGTTVDNGYDDDDRLTSTKTSRASTGDVLVDLGLSYDARGNITQVDDRVGTGLVSSTKALTYDGHGRLTSAVLGTGATQETLTIGYDPLERIAALTSSGGASSRLHQGDYGYTGPAPQAVTSTARARFTNDGRGRVTSRDAGVDGTMQLRWDGFGRLSGIDHDGGPGLSTSWDHIGVNGRLWKRVGSEETLQISEGFEIVDGIARLRLRIAGDVVVEEDSARMTAQIVGDEDGDGVITSADAFKKSGDAQRHALRAAARTLLLGDDGVERAWPLHDHQGSVIAVADDEGVVVERFAYGPHGVVRGSTAEQTGHAVFASARVDRSGVLDLGARQVLAGEGRFIAPDPTFRLLSGQTFERLADAGGLYDHAGNSPVTQVDLDGRYRWTKRRVALAVVIGAGAVVGLAGIGVGIGIGVASGVLPALAVAAAGVAVAAYSTMAIVGAVVGGVTGLATELAVQRERLRTKQIVRQKQLTTADHGWAAFHVVRATIGGAVSGFLTHGISAGFSAAGAGVRIAEYRGKISGRTAVIARTVVALASMTATADFGSAGAAASSMAEGAVRVGVGLGLDELGSKVRAKPIATRKAREAYWSSPTRERGDGLSRRRQPRRFGLDIGAASHTKRLHYFQSTQTNGRVQSKQRAQARQHEARVP